MPLLTDGPPLAIAFIRELVIRGIGEQANLLWTDFNQLVSDLWRHFPNPFLMLNDVTLFSTSIMGRVLTIPFAGVTSILLDILRATGNKNRVMTTEGAVRAIVGSFAEIVTNVTFTSKSGLLETVLTAGARFVWSLWGRFKFLKAVAKWRTEADVIKYFLDKFAKKKTLYGVVAFVIAFFSIVAWIGAMATLVGLGISMVTGEFAKQCLAQDSKRFWNTRKRVRRFNARRGVDFPS